MGKKRITVEITDEQHEFLQQVMADDAAENQSEAVQWCIESCMRIEKNYIDPDGRLDACYVSFYDIRTKEHKPFKR